MLNGVQILDSGYQYFKLALPLYKNRIDITNKIGQVQGLRHPMVTEDNNKPCICGIKSALLNGIQTLDSDHKHFKTTFVTYKNSID